jgi:hypothetical protein
MYPRRTRVLLKQTTRNAYLQAFCAESPLTDSNRRPPPYHEVRRQLVAAGANGFGLFSRLARPAERTRPSRSMMQRPERKRTFAEATSSKTSRTAGRKRSSRSKRWLWSRTRSSSRRRGRGAERSGASNFRPDSGRQSVAATDHRDEPLPVRGALRTVTTAKLSARLGAVLRAPEPAHPSDLAELFLFGGVLE